MTKSISVKRSCDTCAEECGTVKKCANSYALLEYWKPKEPEHKSISVERVNKIITTLRMKYKPSNVDITTNSVFTSEVFDDLGELREQIKDVSELTKLRDLVDYAMEIINYVAGNDKQYSMRLHAKNWLEEAKEVQDEKTRR
jgi:hypothetical protein